MCSPQAEVLPIGAKTRPPGPWAPAGDGAGRFVGFGQRIGDFGQVKLPLLVDDQIQRWAFKSEIRKSPCPADKTLKLGIDEQALKAKAKDWLAICLFEGPQEAIPTLPTLPLKLYRTDGLYHTASPHL